MSIEDIERKLDKIIASSAKTGAWKDITIAKDGTISETLDIGGSFAYLQVVVPTIDSAQLELQASVELDGTYQDVGQDALTVAGTGGFSDTWHLGGWRYIKVKASAAQTTSGRTFKVRGITY